MGTRLRAMLRDDIFQWFGCRGLQLHATCRFFATVSGAHPKLVRNDKTSCCRASGLYGFCRVHHGDRKGFRRTATRWTFSSRLPRGIQP